MSKQITIEQVRAVIGELQSMTDEVVKALGAAPYDIAKEPIESIRSLPEYVAGELGLEVLCACEGCTRVIFDNDKFMFTEDMCWLCEDCMPDDEHMEKLRAIQAACPQHDPECRAQTGDDHERCGAFPVDENGGEG